MSNLPQEELAAAIVLKAVEDYKNYLFAICKLNIGKKKKNTMDKIEKYQSELRDIVSFFKSSWFRTICELDADLVMDKLVQDMLFEVAVEKKYITTRGRNNTVPIREEARKEIVEKVKKYMDDKNYTIDRFMLEVSDKYRKIDLMMKNKKNVKINKQTLLILAKLLDLNLDNIFDRRQIDG